MADTIANQIAAAVSALLEPRLKAIEDGLAATKPTESPTPESAPHLLLTEPEMAVVLRVAEDTLKQRRRLDVPGGGGRARRYVRIGKRVRYLNLSSPGELGIEIQDACRFACRRPGELLTEAEVAQLLRVPQATFAGWRRQGTTPIPPHETVELAAGATRPRYRRGTVTQYLNSLRPSA